MRPTLDDRLALKRCPHCSVATPDLARKHYLETNNYRGLYGRMWSIYVCGNCGGVVTACAKGHGAQIDEYHPAAMAVSDDIPEKPRTYIEQGIASIHAPAGAVMLAASAVDAALKEMNYTEGTLYSRIEKAVASNVITQGMAEWAHDIRLDANDQRHADENAGLPTEKDAKRSIDFALAFAEYLFVLPAKVRRGLGKNPTREIGDPSPEPLVEAASAG